MKAEVGISAHSWCRDHQIIRGPVGINVHSWVVILFTRGRDVFTSIKNLAVEVAVETLECFVHAAGSKPWRWAKFMALAKE